MEKCGGNFKRRDEFSAQDSETSTIISSKKMKTQPDFASDEFTSPSHQQQLQDRRFSHALSPDTVTSSNSGGDFSSGDCVASRIESDLLPKRSADLEANSLETESSTCIDNKFGKEATSSSEFPQNSDEMDPTGGDQSRRKKSQASKMPSQEEIDQFFEEAEKKAQKRFADKYNYDIAKDLPLEGRYQWVSLKP